METLKFEGRILNADKHTFIAYGKYLAVKKMKGMHYRALANLREFILSRDIELEIDGQNVDKSKKV